MPPGICLTRWSQFLKNFTRFVNYNNLVSFQGYKWLWCWWNYRLLLFHFELYQSCPVNSTTQLRWSLIWKVGIQDRRPSGSLSLVVIAQTINHGDLVFASVRPRRWVKRWSPWNVPVNFNILVLILSLVSDRVRAYVECNNVCDHSCDLRHSWELSDCWWNCCSWSVARVYARRFDLIPALLCSYRVILSFYYFLSFL